MSVQHHPDGALLLSYAAGSLDAAMALILATHLSFCTQCRASLALAERVGGILLDEIAPAPLSADALVKTLARLDQPYTPKVAPISNDNTPPPLRAFLGRDLCELHWRKMGPRLAYVTLHRRGPLAMRLLRGVPGSEVGLHTHRGLEYTLVLRGGYTDETGTYGPGDFQTASSELMHNPIADPEEDCVNLSVTLGRLRFGSMLHNIVCRLFNF